MLHGPRDGASTASGTPVVVVAPDSFKGSVSAVEVAGIVAAAFRSAWPRAAVVERAFADGGEGTVDVAVQHGFTPRTVLVEGPLGAPVEAVYARLDDTAVIELASAAGFDALGTAPTVDTARTSSTVGVGQLLVDAMDEGATRIVLGLGGSVTSDGGAGIAHALGARLLDDQGRVLQPCGGELVRLAEVDLTSVDDRLAVVDLVIACDVDNPLLGPDGAAEVYAPQKGADGATVALLEAGLARWADTLARATGVDPRDEPGAGAAGGAAMPLLAIGSGSLVPGVDVVARLAGLGPEVTSADLLVVGEGSLDHQSLRGKGAVALARGRAGPTVAIVGVDRLPAAMRGEAGLDAVHALTDLEPDVEVCVHDARRLLADLAQQVASTWATRWSTGS